MKVILRILSFSLLLISFKFFSQNLDKNFKNPPNSVKPKTWMHAMSGNMSKVGMTKDLEAIAAAGQGGILLFNIANKIPYGNVDYNSTEHHDILTHTAKECERLNLSFGVHNCDGWTSSGGSWIKPEQSMKMVVWSENIIDGGTINKQLLQPTTIEGFYKDIAVIAYPAFESEIIDANAKPIITASDKAFNIGIATDTWSEKSSELKKTGDFDPWITFDYGRAHKISSVYVSYFWEDIVSFLEISDDGINYTKVKTFKKPTRIGKKKRVISEQFDPISARYFRISFEKAINIREINLTQTRPYKDYLKFSGLGSPENYLDIVKNSKNANVIPLLSILNLTGSLSKDGILQTKLPKGKWMVMRFGYTSTGATNWPASKSGIGLECDKFSREAFKIHFDAFSKKVIDNTKKVAPNALQYLEIDSYEMGGQNWTDNFESIFKKEKGYDIISSLPIFAGRYVENPESTSAISYDLNEVYCNLATNNYFKYFTELCNENGIKSYIEPYGEGPLSPLDISQYIDLPMTEFWMGRENQKRLTGTIDGAHIYGKNIISAEAFTATPDVNWKMYPAMAKIWGDMAWVKGVNEFMFHRYVHQPNTNVKPGLTMGTWGSHIDRTQPWWMNAGSAWFQYITRGSYLLRQGYPVADVLVFVGDLPHKDGFKRKELKTKIPNGLNYDCTNTDVLINRTVIQNKTLVLPEGNAYSHLVLQDVDLMALPTLKRLKAIVDAGIPIVGNKPKKLTGYKNSESNIKMFEELVAYIWSKPNCTTNFDFNKVQADFTIKDEDIEFEHRKSKDADIYFFYNEKEEPVNYECTFRVGNKIPELWNANTGEITKLARFKTTDKETIVWLNLKPLESAFIVFRENANNVISIVEANDTYEYQLNNENKISCLANNSGSYNLKLSNGKSVNFKTKMNLKPIDLSTSWDVEFLEANDYKANVKFDKLIDWKDHSNENIKYYSGEAIYRKDFTIAKKLSHSDKTILDLGNVQIAAQVVINGKNAGVVWMPPFTLDISKYVVKGINTIEVKVFNQWTNKLIGDERYPKQDGGYNLSSYIPNDDSKMPDWYINNQPLPKGPRTTFDAGQFYKKGDELISAGLLGPVIISFKQEKIIK
ncbi:glycosyl hydrolase [Flavobacterium faecale]|uniref:glycosyl hydrolase n=1 Tax=Flavobacterium faecale TaxID=1355330 RepID=UPI003AAC133D